MELTEMAARLRAVRTRAGLSGKDLADARSWAQSKVSRIETGKQMPSRDDIEAWAAVCGVSPEETAELLRLRDEARVAHVAFRDRMKRGQTQVQLSYNELVDGAHLVRHFETVYVPGLLQVPQYAGRVLREMISLHGLDVDDVETAVATRMQRQQALYDPSKSFEFLLAEPVLRWLLCPPSVMREQLDRLMAVACWDRVRFGIVPMGVELATTPQNAVQIYVGAEPIAAVETFLGEALHHGDDAAAYGRALDRLWDDAVTGEDARKLILAAARAL